MGVHECLCPSHTLESKIQDGKNTVNSFCSGFLKEKYFLKVDLNTVINTLTLIILCKYECHE